MLRRRTYLLAIVLVTTFIGAGMPRAAMAQVIKPYGMPIPAFFFSGAERRAREACADELPTCRASVRAQMEQEMAISLVIPWIILGAGVLIALFYLRKAERQRAKARELARRHHDPAAFRKLDKEKSQQKSADADDDDRDQLS
jgi:hypothetical protein